VTNINNKLRGIKVENLDKKTLFYTIESMVSSNQSGWHHVDSMLKVY